MVQRVLFGIGLMEKIKLIRALHNYNQKNISKVQGQAGSTLPEKAFTKMNLQIIYILFFVDYQARSMGAVAPSEYIAQWAGAQSSVLKQLSG